MTPDATTKLPPLGINDTIGSEIRQLLNEHEAAVNKATYAFAEQLAAIESDTETPRIKHAVAQVDEDLVQLRVRIETRLNAMVKGIQREEQLPEAPA